MKKNGKSQEVLHMPASDIMYVKWLYAARFEYALTLVWAAQFSVRAVKCKISSVHVHRIHYLTKCSFIRISEQSQPWENFWWKFHENSVKKTRVPHSNNENTKKKQPAAQEKTENYPKEVQRLKNQIPLTFAWRGYIVGLPSTSCRANKSR